MYISPVFSCWVTYIHFVLFIGQYTGNPVKPRYYRILQIKKCRGFRKSIGNHEAFPVK